MTPNQLIEDYIGYAKLLAYKIKDEKRLPIDLEELNSVALLALVKAANTYNQKRALFKTHVRYRVRGDIQDFIRSEYGRKNGQRKNNTISIEELTPAYYKYNMALSIDGTEAKTINKELAEIMIATLSEREAFIVHQYFTIGYNMREVGSFLNLHESRISQIIKKVKFKLKLTIRNIE